MKRLFSVLIIYFTCFYSYSQTSIKLSVYEGNRVMFIFEDSFNEIKNGKTLGTAPNGYTRFKVNYKQDTDFSSVGWVLTVRANTSSLFPDYGLEMLDLSSINLYTYLDGVYQSTITLSNTNQIIATKNISYPPLVALPESHSNEITIVYDCGTSGELWGLLDDNFTTDLIFNVQSQ